MKWKPWWLWCSTVEFFLEFARAEETSNSSSSIEDNLQWAETILDKVTSIAAKLEIMCLTFATDPENSECKKISLALPCLCLVWFYNGRTIFDAIRGVNMEAGVLASIVTLVSFMGFCGGFGFMLQLILYFVHIYTFLVFPVATGLMYTGTVGMLGFPALFLALYSVLGEIMFRSQFQCWSVLFNDREKPFPRIIVMVYCAIGMHMSWTQHDQPWRAACAIGVQVAIVEILKSLDDTLTKRYRSGGPAAKALMVWLKFQSTAGINFFKAAEYFIADPTLSLKKRDEPDDDETWYQHKTSQTVHKEGAPPYSQCGIWMGSRYEELDAQPPAKTLRQFYCLRCAKCDGNDEDDDEDDD